MERCFPPSSNSSPGGLGYTLAWGADLTVAGNFMSANGRSRDGEEAALNQDSEITAPKAGTLRAISWMTQSADATTILKVHVNAVVEETITLTAAAGADATLTTTIAVGDEIGVEFDAGTVPDKTNIRLYIE